jgi:hypothetical protein
MPYDLGESTLCFDFPITRTDEDGLMILSCDKVPDMFAAVLSEDAIRPSIETCLKNALGGENRRVQVFTNGRLDGPIIGTLVKITEE